jgi:hypothetical protein
MPTRRHIVMGALTTPLFLQGHAVAAPRCVPDPKRGGELCKAYVDVTDAYQETYYARREPAAVWIACVAVVFAKYGHVVQQPRIAEEAYGSLDAVPLDKGAKVAAALARKWKDDDGSSFTISVEPMFDGETENTKFDQAALITTVSQGDPVIIMGKSRPVVLTALAYSPEGSSEKLVAGFVFDPLPMIGPRALNIGEVVPKSAGGDLRFAVHLKLDKA